MKTENTNDDTGRIERTLNSLKSMFDRSTERWKDQHPPEVITKERVGMWFKMRELSKILSKRKED